MSKTVHYKGIAKEIKSGGRKKLIQAAEEILKLKNKEVSDYYEDALECLIYDFEDEFFYHRKTKKLYAITKKELEPYDDIISAEIKPNGTIEYELKYYNGGAGFHECMEEAFDKLNSK